MMEMHMLSLVTEPEIYLTLIFFVTLWWSEIGDILFISQSESNYKDQQERVNDGCTAFTTSINV